MSAELFDVYVEGSRDASDQGKQALATAIASRYKMPEAQITAALAKGRVRVGKALDQVTAARLVQQLERLGAVAASRPSGGAPGDAAARVTATGRAASATSEQPTRAGGRTTLPLPAPTPVAPARPAPDAMLSASFGPPPEAVSLNATALPAPSASASAQMMDAFFAPPPGAPGFDAPKPPGARPPTGRATATRDRFAPPDAAEAPLELARPSSGGVRSSASHPQAPSFSGPSLPERVEYGVPSGLGPSLSAVNLPTVAGATSRPQPRLDEDPVPVAATAARKPAAVRCAKHGLLYDPGRTNGCRKCDEVAGMGDAMARVGSGRIAGPSAGFSVAAVRQDPVKHAFAGLLIALFVGFVPVSLYAWQVNAADVDRLRAQQEDLSHRVGTEATIRQFDELDDAVHNTRRKGAWKAFFMWLVISGGLVAAWHKAVPVTQPAPADPRNDAA